MGEHTRIEWCDHTFNPWWGCQKLSPACENCYAAARAKRFGHRVWGPAKTTPRRLLSANHWKQPLRWNEKALGEFGRRARVFSGSMCDVFEDHPQLPPLRVRLWELVEATENLKWLFLTKRPQNVLRMVPLSWLLEGFPSNVRVGATAENQAEADERIPELLKIPAGLFLSCEPLLGPIDLSPYFPREIEVMEEGTEIRPNMALIQQVIVGGESHAGARPMHPEWPRDLRDQCLAAGVPFFFKAWGEWAPEGPVTSRQQVICARRWHGQNTEEDLALHDKLGHFDSNPTVMYRVGREAAGHLLDGVEYHQFPELLQEVET